VLVGGGCSGVLVDGPDLVLTAEHCITGSATHALKFSDGSERTGWVAGVDHESDQALLLLEEPVRLAPLALVRQLPIGGTILYFAGNPRNPRFQEAKLERTGRCPSLPGLGSALFTTIKGIPGDSGAPIVDAGRARRRSRTRRRAMSDRDAVRHAPPAHRRRAALVRQRLFDDAPARRGAGAFTR
jgi:S1-C subfamily serine protease